MSEFEERIRRILPDGLRSDSIEVLQVNVGLRCNQACRHCHLEASPERTEMMEWSHMERVLAISRIPGLRRVEITGGAPELHPHFRRFVESLRRIGHCVQVRTNLTVLLDRDMATLPEFFKEHSVHLVASLPCYSEENVRAQRGNGVYEKSIEAIRHLNALGYASRQDLPLDLVYNPAGDFLPPEQTSLEADYRRELNERFGIRFSHLLTITNMPIGRLLRHLRSQGRERKYHRLLRDSFNPDTLPSLMCRHQISVGWDGRLYDCDFNLALGLPVGHGAPDHLDRFDAKILARRRNVTGAHCFGCTAGSGSSCGGALV